MNRARFLSRFRLGSLAVVVLLARSAAGQLLERDSRFVDGLRSRRVFSLAESYCRESRDQEKDAPLLADWTVALMRVLAAKAAQATPSVREVAWQAVTQEADRFLQQHREHPRRWLVRYQAALSQQARAELLRFESGEMREGRARNEAIASLRQASTSWTDLLVDLQDAASGARGAPPGATMSAKELSALANNAAFQMARAAMFRADLYPADSNDYTSAVQQAIDHLEQVRARLLADDPLTWDILADLTACYRRLAQWSEAEAVWSRENASAAPASATIRLRAETMRALAAQGKLDHALSLRRPEDDRLDAADLDLALLEVLVAKWKRAVAEDAESGETKRLAKRVEQSAVWMADRYGPLWRRKADALLLRNSPRSAFAGQWERVRREAAELAADNQVKQAIDLLDQTLRDAAPEDAEAGLALGYQAAVLTRNLGRVGEHLERLRSVALRFSDADKAPDAHLQAIAVSIALARKDPSMLALYHELIDEHLDRFGDRPTGGRVRIWKASGLAQQGLLDEAQRLLLSVAGDASWSGEAARETGLLQLRRLSEDDTPVNLAAPLREGVALAGSHPASRTWNAWRVLVEIAGGTTNGARPAEQATTADEQLALAVSAAAAGQTQQALGALSNVEDPRLLTALLDILESAARRSAAPTRKRLAELLLQAMRLPSVPTSAVTDRRRGLALRWTGQRRQALELLKTKAKASPSDLAAQLAYGNLLLEGAEAADLPTALQHWRTVAARCAPQTAAWYQAKYGVARAQFLSGDRAAAAKLIRFVAATTQWKGCPNREEFAELLRASER